MWPSETRLVEYITKLIYLIFFIYQKHVNNLSKKYSLNPKIIALISCQLN